MASVQIPVTWTAQDVRAWLLRTFKDRRSDPIPLFRDLDLSVQIQRLSDNSPADVQETLKAGAALAVREWRSRAHGTAVLEDLCNVVALLKVTAAIPTLDRIARSVLAQRHDVETADVLSAIIGTLGGLAPGEDVERAVRSIFDDPRCPPQLAGQLFVSLCRCRPERYWQFVPRFRELRDRSPEPFVNITLAGSFAEAVPATAIHEGLARLTGADRSEIVWLIEHVPDARQRAVLIQGMGQSSSVQVTPSSGRPPAVSDPHAWAHWFQKEAAPFSQKNMSINEALMRSFPRVPSV